MTATGKLRRSRPRGVAMLIVLWVIMVLSLLIGGFAFTMHVETQVATFSRKELKAEWLARSGIEVARMQLLLDLQSATEGGYDARTQAWATNFEWYVDHLLGEGAYNVNVIDEESKMPLNLASPEQLGKLLNLLGLDPADADVITDSIGDWVDDDDLHKLNGAEDDYYMSLSPPYHAKNATLDRVEELLMIRGVTPEIYGGLLADEKEGLPERPGLKDLLSTLSPPVVNVNTASGYVIQAWLGLDDAQIQAVLSRRDGGDGLPGTEDDQPFATVDEFMSYLGGGANDEQRQQLRNLVTVNSTFFTITATGNCGGVQRTIATTVRRDNGQLVVVEWREKRGGVS